MNHHPLPSQGTELRGRTPHQSPRLLTSCGHTAGPRRQLDKSAPTGAGCSNATTRNALPDHSPPRQLPTGWRGVRREHDCRGFWPPREPRPRPRRSALVEGDRDRRRPELPWPRRRRPAYGVGDWRQRDRGWPGRVFRTTDGGRTWEDVSPPGTEGLLFRDVEARSAEKAVILAIGPGDASRIYRTTDGGATWDAAFVNDDPAAFYDCMAFYPGGRRGLVMGDPVDGKFRILATHDFGRSWSVLPDDGMPEAPTEYRLRGQRRLPRHGWPHGVLRLRRRRRARLPFRRLRPDLDRQRLHDPGRRGSGRVRPVVPYAVAGRRRRR